MSKRKRIKLECLECGSHFDDDYKTRHESIMHNGKRVRVQHVGAPSSPFEVCKKKASEPPAPKIPYSAPQPVDGGSPKAEAVQKPPTDGKLSSSPTSPSNQPSLSPSSSPRPSSPTSNNESEDKCAWIRVAGQVAEFLKNYERVEDILKKLKNDAVPNPKLFMIDIIDCLTRIHEESGTLLNYAKKEEGKLQFETLALHVGEEVSVEHDPGRRKKTLTENERKYLNAVGPFQLKLSVFPANPNIPANKQCRMSSVWYCEYPLLEYSLNKDAAFCFACSLFPEGVGRSHSQPEWVSDGVQQWHKMKSRGANRPGKLFAHFSSESHRAAMSDLCHFINGEAHVDILLNKSIREKKILEEQEKEYHRKVVEILVDVTKTLGRQGLAFRGHDSSGKNEDGNFTQVVNLISRHCPVMEKWLNEENSRSRHVTYLSAESQNEFIDLSGSETRQVILKEVEDAEFLSIMGDTTPDSSHKDRLATNIRYVVEKNGEPVPVERLLKMDVVLTKKTGEELAEKMFTTLTSSNIPVKKLIFQSYDFARNMSGEYNGAQRKLSEKCNKNILYVPCQAHRINIFVETACTASSIIKEFFDILHALYVFFAGSTKRFQSLIEELEKVENFLLLKNLSLTRWTARAESIKAVWIAFEEIVDVLEKIRMNKNDFDSKTRAAAAGLLKNVLHFDFISSLFFMKNVMFKIKILTESLESENLNVVDGLKMIKLTLKSCEEMNDVNQLNNLIESSVSFAKKLDINPESDFAKQHRKRRAPKKLDENPKTAFTFDLFTFYRKEFKTVFDVFTTSVRKNLEESLSKFEPIQKIFEIPADRKNCTIESINSIVELQPESFKQEPECIQVEIQALLDLCDECENFVEISKKAYNLRQILPWAYKIVRFVLTSPVTSASCERSFSKLKLVMNSLRNTMGDDRLDSLMLLFSAKDIVDEMNVSKVVQTWSQLKHRRVRT